MIGVVIGALLALAARAGAAGLDEDAADPEDAAGSAPASADGIDPEDAEGASLEGPGALDDPGGDASAGASTLGDPGADASTEADAGADAGTDALDDAGDGEGLAGEDGDPGGLDPEAAEAAGPSAASRLERGFASRASLAGAFELIEPEPRPPDPWRWGELDLTVAWRRAYDDDTKGSSRRDELWLLVIWRQ